MKIGIMGGTFDPIHNGHLMLGNCAYDNFNLDEIWFLPNGNPPHKSGETNVEDRPEMVKSAIYGNRRFRLNTYEAERKSNSYSYQTLENFKNIYPEHDFYFIVGADSLFAIESWKEPKRIMNSCTLLAACRDDKNDEDMKAQISYLKEKYHAHVELLRAPLMDISSSNIRKMTEYGMNIKSFVPQSVCEYIETHHLYRRGNVS